MSTSDSRAFALPSDLTSDVRLGSRGLSVTFRGDVDVHSAPQLRDRLAEVVRQGERLVEVHLDDVSFMDSTGLGVLVGGLKAQRAAGGDLELVCSQPRLLRILQLTGLDRVFVIHDGRPSATA